MGRSQGLGGVKARPLPPCVVCLVKGSCMACESVSASVFSISSLMLRILPVVGFLSALWLAGHAQSHGAGMNFGNEEHIVQGQVRASVLLGSISRISRNKCLRKRVGVACVLDDRMTPPPFPKQKHLCLSTRIT